MTLLNHIPGPKKYSSFTCFLLFIICQSNSVLNATSQSVFIAFIASINFNTVCSSL